MVPPPDETPESLDGQVTSDGEPDRPVEKSLGEGETAGNDPSTDSGGEAFGEDWTPPEMLADRYRLGDELGRGGMGVVYQARDTHLKRTVAVKLISRGTVARFQTEAEAVAQLNHPNIAHVYEFNQQDDLHYIVMEHVEGKSLSQRLAQGTIPAEEAIRITVSLCDALSHAHGKGIIHRDIKPSNVLLSDEGVPKLVDFGLARVDSDDGQLTRGGLGTPAYVAPEQAKDGTLADARSDLWSLAASLYHMITGRIPRVIRLDDLTASLHEVLGKALEDVPDSRYQSADDFRDALEVVLDSPVAPQPRKVSEDELVKGQCAQCGVLNELSRKFCEECATGLRVSCLACGEQISVWDKVCGECGAKQVELLNDGRSRMQQRREDAELLFAEQEYEKSRDITEAIAAEPDVRLQQLQQWATGFLESLVQKGMECYKRGVAHRKNGNHDEAISDYTEAIRLDPGYAEAYYARGFAHYHKCDYDAAISDYTEAIRLKPEYAEVYYNRGLAHRYYSGYDAAISDYTEAIRLKPEYAEAYYNRGLVHRHNGDHGRAISDYTEAIRLKPENAEAYYARGVTHRKNGDHDEAISDYTEAIRLDPGYAEAYYARGVAHSKNDDHDEAISDYTELFRLNPEYAEAYYNRGVAHHHNGDHDEAISDYVEAIRLSPEYANAYHSRGVSHELNGDHDAAITDYTEAIRLNPEYAEAYWTRGFSHEQMGNRAEAEADYQRAKELGYEE